MSGRIRVWVGPQRLSKTSLMSKLFIYLFYKEVKKKIYIYIYIYRESVKHKECLTKKLTKNHERIYKLQ
jgi:hypothetical protein